MDLKERDKSKCSDFEDTGIPFCSVENGDKSNIKS